MQIFQKNLQAAQTRIKTYLCPSDNAESRSSFVIDILHMWYKGRRGSVDRGDLFLDDQASTFTDSSELASVPGATSELAAIPYAFRIGG